MTENGIFFVVRRYESEFSRAQRPAQFVTERAFRDEAYAMAYASRKNNSVRNPQADPVWDWVPITAALLPEGIEIDERSLGDDIA